jgi:type IV pilus assembly protein PilA
VRHAALPVLIFVVAFLIACNSTPPVHQLGETSPIKAITTIHTAQVQYYSTYNRFATSLQELGPPASGSEGPAAAGLIDRDLASGEKDGYKYTVQATPNGYNVTAMPTQYSASRRKTFFSDQGMKIHQHIGQEPATMNDPTLGE